jgi:NifU-like protein involved in Fe-S cluster formation
VPSVYDYFERALRRDMGDFRSTPGNESTDVEGNRAVFNLDVDRRRIATARYRCTTCVTLVALCEHLTDLLPGMTLEQARSFTAAELLRLHPEIPPGQRDRAVLAVAAAHSALTQGEHH